MFLTEKKLIVGSDHAAFAMKAFVINLLTKKGIEVVDAGPLVEESVDYPEYGAKVAKAVASGEFEAGVLLCGSGIGISIAANRFNGVRAALCQTEEYAQLSREHNNSNIVVLGGRTTSEELVEKIVDTWLNTEFEGGRHQRRIDQLDTVVK